MKSNKKIIVGITLGIIIGASTVVGAATIFRSEDITYSSSATTKTNVKDSLDELYNLTSNYKFYKPLANQVELGDYISMTPTSSSYTIPARFTGADSDQTINPSNLNLWRVIKKNDDGTIDAVSEYVSNEKITFKGKIGYLNYVGILNQIAAQYTNKKYVQDTRHMGYNGQTKNCSTLEECPSDTGYENDWNLIQEVIGRSSAFSISGGEKFIPYFLASRMISYDTSADGFVRYRVGRYDEGNQQNEFSTGIYDSTDRSYAPCFSVRCILTFKATNVIKSGDGKSAETAYTFE